MTDDAVEQQVVTPADVSPETAAIVDDCMLGWRQGDIAPYDRFVHLANSGKPVTRASVAAASASPHGPATLRVGTSTPDGLVVLTQTCDIRRGCVDRPYVELAPIVRVPRNVAAEAWAMERPRYAAIPILGDDAVADLDRCMTVEKGLLAELVRTPGWSSDMEVQRFATVVGRRFVRFAFPDSFGRAVGKLADSIASKHNKVASPEGQLLQHVRQIRVSADPSWESESISVELAFILEPGVLPRLSDEPTVPQHHASWLSSKRRTPAEIAARVLAESEPDSRSWLWDRLAEAWASTCVLQAPYADFDVQLIGADEYTVDRYWSSQQLDLDHLSIANE